MIPVARLHQQSARHIWQIALCLEPWNFSVLPGSQSDSQPQQHLWLTRLEIRAPVRRVVQPGSQEPTKVAYEVYYACAANTDLSNLLRSSRSPSRARNGQYRSCSDGSGQAIALRRVVVMGIRFSTETADSR
jgi:hypothetical protein